MCNNNCSMFSRTSIPIESAKNKSFNSGGSGNDTTISCKMRYAKYAQNSHLINRVSSLSTNTNQCRGISTLSVNNTPLTKILCNVSPSHN